VKDFELISNEIHSLYFVNWKCKYEYIFCEEKMEDDSIEDERIEVDNVGTTFKSFETTATHCSRSPKRIPPLNLLGVITERRQQSMAPGILKSSNDDRRIIILS
jgi:hypothetical protein